MKKRVSIIVAILIIFISSTVLATTTFTARFEADKSVLGLGEEVELVLKLENFTENENGINVLLGTLEYDKAIFEEIKPEDITAIQNWDAPTYNKDNGMLLIDSYMFINTSHNAIKIKLKVKDSIEETTTTEIKLKDISASDGTNDIAVEDARAIFQVEPKSSSENDTANVADNKMVIMIIAILGVIILGSIAIVMVKRKNK